MTDLRNRTHHHHVEVFLDGDQWCALIGPNIIEGTCGFAETPLEALRQLCIALEDNLLWSEP